MRALVLLNQQAGTLATMQADDPLAPIAAAFQNAGVDAEIRAVPAERLVEEARHAASDKEFDIVVGGGGDGTLSTIAGALAGTYMPMGLLPLGTLNHFSKDLGIPAELDAAAMIVAGENQITIDVAEVNGRVFVNNSSLGFYPQMVAVRDEQRKQAGWSKWPAMAWAALKIFRRFPLLVVRIQTQDAVAGGETIVKKTPLVFIGNNDYSMELFRVGTRDALDRGRLCLYLADVRSRWGLLKLMFRAVCGRLEQSRDFLTYSLTECQIESRRSHLKVAVDGEIVDLKPPLNYVIRAKALTVRIPNPPVAAEHAGAQERIGA